MQVVPGSLEGPGDENGFNEVTILLAAEAFPACQGVHLGAEAFFQAEKNFPGKFLAECLNLAGCAE